MKAFSSFLGLIFGLALLAGLLAGGYFLFIYVAELFHALEQQLAAIMAIASMVALLCAIIIAGGLKSRNHKETNSRSATEKVNIYKQLLSLSIILLQNRAGDEIGEADGELFTVEQLLALHGSPRVITAYMELRRQAGQKGNQGDGVPGLLNNLVVSMREDLGVSTSNLKEKQIPDLLLCRF